jgi:para-aminobenzoate synthetase / 4-amino-4-deoxychorismate lyase
MIHSVVLQYDGRWLRFGDPVRVVTAVQPGEVLPGLQAIEEAVNDEGLLAAGFISYEAAAGFDPILRTRSPIPELPLLCFALYRPENVTTAELEPVAAPIDLEEWQPSISRQAYGEAIDAVKEHIAQGETYQVNYTLRLRTPFRGDPWLFFRHLATAQQAQYAAYLDLDRFAVCSASPELFFRLDGESITTRPMKGTAARGLTLAQDEEQAEWLRRSEKNRAENVMIVDMMRNDLGRVARIGSVHVPALFAVERYPTVWQMTSTVTAETAAPLSEILSALFPSSSITGAPKVRTMQIIAALETEPRGVYTGAIGVIAPGRQAQFNVAIRTVVVDKERGQAQYGVGGGIVWDSLAAEEYEECRIKARVLTAPRADFSLLETMLWQPATGYYLLAEHLQRMAASAVYFGFDFSETAVRRRLDEQAASLPPDAHRIRLLLARDGEITLESYPLAQTAVAQRIRLGLAVEPISSANLFLYHKTTQRQVYDSARASRPDCDDVLLWNERDEVTESTVANLVVERDGRLLTPPVSSGLLAGIFRRRLLEEGQIQETVITVDELPHCQKLYLINSVRQWREVTFLKTP